jgi:hypothetical protein
MPALQDPRRRRFGSGREGNYLDTPPPPPCFCHEYQNKGVKSAVFGINIKTKAYKSFVLILIYALLKAMDIRASRWDGRLLCAHARCAKTDRPSLRFRVARVVRVSQLNNSTEY